VALMIFFGLLRKLLIESKLGQFWSVIHVKKYLGQVA
jgi:hypothetical protein